MREGRLLLWEEDLEALRRGPARGAGGGGRDVPQQTPTGGAAGAKGEGRGEGVGGRGGWSFCDGMVFLRLRLTAIPTTASVRRTASVSTTASIRAVVGALCLL